MNPDDIDPNKPDYQVTLTFDALDVTVYVSSYGDEGTVISEALDTLYDTFPCAQTNVVPDPKHVYVEEV